MPRGPFSGVLSPTISPVAADGSVDTIRFQALCKWQLANGLDGLATFGTTSEANSIALTERMKQTEALVKVGVPASKLMPGTGTCSLMDTVALTKQAVELGAGGVLLLPPFFYRAATDDGLFAYVSEVIRLVADDRLKIYLYHIPPFAMVGWSVPLIQRLVQAFPNIVVGLKDSSGDWKNTKAILDNVPDFDAFPGSELFLLDGFDNGAAGCISATANVNPAGIRTVIDAYHAGDKDTLDTANDKMRKVRTVFQNHGLITGVKAAVAHYSDDDIWSVVRPPLVGLDSDATGRLVADLTAVDFSIDFQGSLG